jgi:hypothetical protein
MQYMFIHAVDEGLEWDETLTDEVQSALDIWLEEVNRLGVELQGSRLRPTSDATTVRVRNQEVVVSDGPFAESKEQVAGYDIIDCENLEEALAWAAKHPTSLIGSIEVRPFFDDSPQATLPEPKETTMRYMLIVCVDENVRLSPEEGSRVGPDTEDWVRTADAKGARLFGNRLAPISTAQTVRVREGRTIVTDGPFAETKEQIAGFDILECADLDEALDLAASHPAARFGVLEVRPLWSFDVA